MMPPFSYREIANELSRRIQAGQYTPGSPLPSYGALAEEYKVSTSTVQRAVLVLRERGVVVGRQGHGVFVVERVNGSPGTDA
jgi:DNA-binding GntR family transcriptional regulator